MKSERHARILELISKYEIETQEEMMERLLGEGFKVTQATVSRDLKELKLAKTLTPRGTYRYTVHGTVRYQSGNVKLNNAMVDSIVMVDYSMNNVVVKTYPGMAQGVASAIDSLSLPQILGCVAGDDTIIIVTRDTESSVEISNKITDIIKSF